MPVSDAETVYAITNPIHAAIHRSVRAPAEAGAEE